MNRDTEFAGGAGCRHITPKSVSWLFLLLGLLVACGQKTHAQGINVRGKDVESRVCSRDGITNVFSYVGLTFKNLTEETVVVPKFWFQARVRLSDEAGKTLVDQRKPAFERKVTLEQFIGKAEPYNVQVLRPGESFNWPAFGASLATRKLLQVGEKYRLILDIRTPRVSKKSLSSARDKWRPIGSFVTGNLTTGPISISLVKCGPSSIVDAL